MADLKTYPNRGAFQGTGTPVTDHIGRHTNEDVVQVVDSSRDALQIQESLTLKAAVAVVLAVWLAAVILLGARDAFVSSVGMPPIAI
jgi:hypothetical protein